VLDRTAEITRADAAPPLAPVEAEPRGETAASVTHHGLSRIGDLLRRSAQRDPNKTAVICGDVTWTFAEMDAACNRLGRGLLGLGIGKGDRVAVLSRNSHAFAALRFALARLGAVLVPINFMLKAAEVAYILRHSGAQMLEIVQLTAFYHGVALICGAFDLPSEPGTPKLPSKGA